jgi:hypothetical protein
MPKYFAGASRFSVTKKTSSVLSAPRPKVTIMIVIATTMCTREPRKKRRPSRNSETKSPDVAVSGSSIVAGTVIARTVSSETRKLAALISNAHWAPKVRSSGAARGGPTRKARLYDAWLSPTARGRSGSGTMSRSRIDQEGRKNWATALATKTTRKIAASCQASGSEPSMPGMWTIPVTGRSDSTRSALSRSARIITRRLSRQRSTKTPATGPTTRIGIVEATSKPLTASDFQDLSGASSVAIQTTSVVSNTVSPRLDNV